jgi:Rps23 Pro-64 3,4-dihydroxylase Tpa1-like proline 4-hydroxylase
MIDYELLQARKEDLTRFFREARPFRWIQVDGFLREPWATRLHADFGAAVQRSGKEPNAPRDKHVRAKIGIAQREQMGDIHREFFDAIHEPRFMQFLQELTGIRPIVADPGLVGAGLHEIHAGGYLNVHADFNQYPQTGQHRRLNLLLYLNAAWREDWEGKLELWPADFSAPFAEIAALCNRMVLFETSETSFQGHPKPWGAPPAITRRSLAAYYYSTWPQGVTRRERTDYRLVPWQDKKLREDIATLRSAGLEGKAIVSTLADRYEKADVLDRLG